MRMALAKTRRAKLVSVVQLYKALGGGWSPAAPAEATTRPVYPRDNERFKTLTTHQHTTEGDRS